MKKKYILLLLSITAIGLSSCKKENIVQQPLTNRTILADIFAKDWTITSDGRSYFKEIALPENDAFNKNGAVVVGMAFDDPGAFEGLPHVFSGRTYRYVAQVGKITFYVNDANGGVVAKPDYDVTVKITLVDGELIP
ncbi:hypothetical protein [Pedobacter sp. NJ-S-72]